MKNLVHAIVLTREDLVWMLDEYAIPNNTQIILEKVLQTKNQFKDMCNECEYLEHFLYDKDTKELLMSGNLLHRESLFDEIDAFIQGAEYVLQGVDNVRIETQYLYFENGKYQELFSEKA